MLTRSTRRTRPYARLKRGVSLRRMGKKGREWNKAWRAEKPRIAKAGIAHCEIGFKGCWKAEALTPAHAVKRRRLSRFAEPGTPEHIASVCIACVPCHRILDSLPPQIMSDLVMQAIRRRQA